MDIKEFNKIYENIMDEYFENKRAWLLDEESLFYDSTIKSYMSYLTSCIHPIEKANRKDLRNFTSIEIENLIRNTFTNSMLTKRTIFTLIKSYCNYNVEKGKIDINPCDGISTDGLFSVSKNAIRNIITTLSDFYEDLEELCGSYNDKLQLLLIRYGVRMA